MRCPSRFPETKSVYCLTAMKKVKILRLFGLQAELDRRILWPTVARLKSLCALVLVWPLVENHHFTKWRTSVDRLKNENFHMEKSNSRNHAVVLATDGSGSGQVYNSNYVSRSVI